MPQALTGEHYLVSRSQVTDAGGGVWRYGWDDKSRLISVTDPEGNRQVLNTYEDSDRVTAQKLADDSTFRFAYTAMNGKTIQTEVTDRRGANLASNGTNQYTWNVQDLLAGIDGAETASFSYDMSGRRRDQTVNGHRTQSYWLGDELNFMVRENDWDHRMRVFSPYPASGPDELTYRRLGEDAGEDRYALRDGNNNVIALTDTDQRIRTQYSYELYGRTKLTGDDDVNAQQYTARENDGDGLYYYRGRYYSPSIGRFISEDPVGYASGQTNAYAYVGGNPVSYSDPSGLQVPFPYTPVPPPSGAGSNTPSWVSPPCGAQGASDWIRDTVGGIFSNGDADDRIVYPNNPQEAPGNFEPIRGTRGKKCLDDGSV